MTSTIYIQGAGLAGLTAGIYLQKQGIPVVIYEKKADVGQRFHGDLQGLENWSEKADILDELKDAQIDLNFELYPGHRIHVLNTINQTVVARKQPINYLVKRGSFPGSLDYGLKQQFLDAGGVIQFHCQQPLHTPHIIATGPVYQSIPGVVKGMTFQCDLPNCQYILFNDTLAYKGYSYFLVANGHACLSTVVMRDFQRAASCFEATYAFFMQHLGFSIQSPKIISGTGSFHFHSCWQKESSRLVGEAAGMQDLLWGFGMRYAISSGYWAARSIMENTDFNQKAVQLFAGKLRASMVNRFCWEKLSGKNYQHFVYLAPLATRFLRFLYSESLLHKFLYKRAHRYLIKQYPALNKNG